MQSPPSVRKPARRKGGVEGERERASGETKDIRVRKRDEVQKEKDADVIVLDASVLVHALPQVKKWCRDGREEIVIVPLEGENAVGLPSCGVR